MRTCGEVSEPNPGPLAERVTVAPGCKSLDRVPEVRVRRHLAFQRPQKQRTAPLCIGAGSECQ